ncbi:acriflavin resistance protein [Thermincola ferriacetica]|uniref:Acriflavin resistance protein n=1 Tax=Thermincola ferriacetica TaxID=281456 RepID=A0A0L6W652_9FIRM|nr:efflux RND transporter permease subunit [Thermincola ferriacetica]KNZ70995.1 acriflavin resistance protein [Thermincola ferriacetica]
MNLTQLSIKRPAMMTMVIMVFVVLGLYTYHRMGAELFPSVNLPYVAVVTNYPGAGAEEIETQITKPLEDELASLSQLKRIRSQASEGFTFTVLEFEMSADADKAAMDVQKKVDMIKGRLPEDASDPVVYKQDINDQPVLIMALQSKRPLYETKKMAEDMIKDRLQKIAGVADVSVVGGQKREIVVSVDKAKLAGYGLSLNQIINRLRAENLNQPSGRLDRPEAEYNVRVLGEFKSLDDIRNLDIPTGNGASVPLSAVATVTDGYQEVREYSRVNGISAVSLMVFKQSDASIVEVGERVKEEIDKIQRELPEDVKIIVSRDTSQFIRTSLDDTRNSIIEGICTTALALYIFLREWRSTVIVALAIPTSLLAALMMMFFAGFTFNMLSLMGLALCIGILVDDSIVVIENIHRHLKMGKDPATAALDGRMEIGMAAVAITLSDVVVFTPIAFMRGMVGQFFRQFGLTVVFATLFSLFVSFTLTPMLAAKLFKQEKGAGDEAGLTGSGRKSLFSWLWKRTGPVGQKVKETYLKFLHWSLDHRKTVLISVILLFLASLTLPALNIVGAEQMPKIDQGDMTVNLEMPVGTPIGETDKVLKEIERYLATIPEIKYYHTTLGSSGGMQGTSAGSHLGRIGIQLYEKKQRERTIWEIGDQIRKWGQNFTGGKISVTEADNMGPPGGDIEIQVTGNDTQKLVALADQVKATVARIPGARDVDTDWRIGQPEIQIKIDRRKASDAGLSVDEIARTVRAGLNGYTVGKFRQGGDETDINIRVENLNKSDINHIKSLPVSTVSGNVVQLQQLADIAPGSGPTEIKRIDRQRAIVVKGNLRGRSLNEFLQDAQKEVNKIKLPPGYHITFAGQAEGMKETFADLISALALSIILVYMVLVMLYESFMTPFIRMMALPLGVVGALLALAITGNTLNLFSMIGLIMMDGLVAKNGTLLIDYTHTLMNRGLTLREALVEAGKTRLRPIIMTTFTMIFGMLPTALALGEGAETRSSMAWVLIGGLITSTVFTLIVIPVVYTIMDDYKQKFTGFISRRKSKEVQAG